ncbi:multidrug effflux MFS transporter [Noviherbaspirillum sedimenti]|uniref:Bcr/CflA family efflux transporter n=1 Tax=Noviherbaspirillum sedimenti TaxID=2320865 RepID=A0A3A3G0J0_9BURK|nr:multidrug effflux MFS transporter [Noviherbaspirillum sedimenti]RJG01978.1 Bcr/CflA family efflux MFS transporter [Noviherbaspirillum sedimenti]
MQTTPTPAPTHIRPPSPTLLAILLAGLAMLGPFSIDTYLPAFPDIQAGLHASAIEVQQTLTAYMLSFALMILWHGALSDAFGRRNITLGSLAVFAVASLGCAAAHSVEYLWAFRILQGVSAGAGVVIGRAVIRDMYADARAARLLSLVTMIFSIAPAIAPILGGWIVKLLDWRSIFLFLFAFTVLLLWFCYKRLPETLPPEQRQPFNPAFLAQSYKKVLRSPRFHLKTGVVAFNFAGLFLYVAAAPIFITRHLGLGPGQFGWQFIPAVGGIFLGALAANRLAGKMPVPRQVIIGFCFLIGAGLFNVLYHAFFPPALPWSVVPLFFYCFGMSVVAPGVTFMVLDLFPEIRGTVASCQSFVQTMLGALVAGVIAPLLWGSVLWLAAGQLIFATVGLALWLAVGPYRRRAQMVLE